MADNDGDFSLVWIDTLLSQSSHLQSIQESLRSVQIKVQFCTDIDQCLRSIRKIIGKQILLVVSGLLAHVLLPLIQFKHSIRGAFIFCEVRASYSDLLNEYPEQVIDICTDRKDLIQSISHVMKLIEKERITFSLSHPQQKITRELTNKSKLFLKNLLWISVLKSMPADERAKQEMLQYCTVYYQNDLEQLKNIEVFRQSYTSIRAMEYYREDSFLYRLLRKALCDEDIHLLYTFRFLLIDLCAQLESGKQQWLQNGPLVFYRNQAMSDNRFEQLKENIGALIMINDYLWTSDDARSSQQISKSPPWNERIIQVQITIQVDPTIVRSVAFAKLKRFSESPKTEYDVLFSVGSVFRIDGCDYDESVNVGKLTLTATDEGSSMLQSYQDVFSDQRELYSPLVCFGRYLLEEINSPVTAMQFFHMLLETLPSDHPDIADVYNQMGATHYKNAYTQPAMGDEERSNTLNMFEKALEIRQSMFGAGDFRVASSWNNIGSVHNDRAEYDRALDCYQRGLEILDKAGITEHLNKANLLTNCGILNDRMGKYEAAISFHVASDDILSRLLHVHHPSHVRRMTVISDLCIKMDDFHRALQFNERALKYAEAMYLPSDRTFLRVWINGVRSCLKFDRQPEAVAYLSQALELCAERDSTLSDHYLWAMAQLCAKSMHFELALNYYQAFYQSKTAPEMRFLAEELFPEPVETEDLENDTDGTMKTQLKLLDFKLSAYEKIFPANDEKHAIFLAEMGRCINWYDKGELAGQCYQQALGIYEGLSTIIDQPGLKTCYEKLFDIYLAKADERAILIAVERALSNNSLDKTGFLRHVVYAYKENDDISNAMKYLKQAFTHAEMTSSYDDILALLSELVELSIKNDQEQTMQTYVDRALKIFANDCVRLVECHQKVGETYEYQNIKNKAIEHFGRLLHATETDPSTSCSVEALDRLWIQFLSVDRSIYYSFGPLGETITLHSLRKESEKYVPSDHWKVAVLLWHLATRYERAKIINMALNYFQEAMTIARKLLDNENDSRARAAFNCMMLNDLETLSFYDFEYWLKQSLVLPFQTVGAATDVDKWKCILKRLVMLKMLATDNQWKFYLKMEFAVLSSKLSTILFDELLQLSGIDQCFENDASLESDRFEIICALEFVSHWYLIRDQFSESLAYRQRQLALESKMFSDEHPHVAGSLWFMGLVYQKMKEYDVSHGYFQRALHVLQRQHPHEHPDIRMLEKHIMLTNHAARPTNANLENAGCG